MTNDLQTKMQNASILAYVNQGLCEDAERLKKTQELELELRKENAKLKKQLAIAVEALETIEQKSDKFDDSWGIQEQLDFIKAEAQSRLYQIKELDK